MCGVHIASQITGALWEYPPAICGQHINKISLQHTSDQELSKAAGVRMIPSTFYFPNPIDSDDFQREMEEILASGVVGFNHGGKSLIAKQGIDTNHGGVDAYEIMVLVIDTDAAMAWLMVLVKVKGVKMVTEAIHGDLLQQEQQLQQRFQVDTIVNCTDIAGGEVAADNTCYPIRGGLIHLINDGKNFPKVGAAMTISANVARHNEIMFIPHYRNLDLTLDSPVMQRMKAHCEAFLSALKNAHIDLEYPIVQGLRPFHGTNIRVERELRCLGLGAAPSRIIHSYGHGGAGWSLSSGCAGDVLQLVEEALMDLKLKGTTSASQFAVVPTRM
ncbi:hypothetical protein L218DRAFT_978251 [Marasmius fiardii PR-910]|nr:hypothetical protein L218DRAFT_978251 [Marasmius fiardii PR-910]